MKDLPRAERIAVQVSRPDTDQDRGEINFVGRRAREVIDAAVRSQLASETALPEGTGGSREELCVALA